MMGKIHLQVNKEFKLVGGQNQVYYKCIKCCQRGPSGILCTLHCGWHRLHSLQQLHPVTSNHNGGNLKVLFFSASQMEWKRERAGHCLYYVTGGRIQLQLRLSDKITNNTTKCLSIQKQRKLLIGQDLFRKTHTLANLQYQSNKISWQKNEGAHCKTDQINDSNSKTR